MPDNITHEYRGTRFVYTPEVAEDVQEFMGLNMIPVVNRFIDEHLRMGLQYEQVKLTVTRDIDGFSVKVSPIK